MTNPLQQPDLKTITLPVIAVFLVCTLVLLLVYRYTEETVNNNIREYELGTVKNLMTLPHDNNLLDDYLVMEKTSTISGYQPLTAYRARQGERVVGVVFKPVVAKGYSGPVELAVGVAADGTILGVDVLSHRETEGLGDQIDRQQSNWLDIFTGLVSPDMQAQDWATRSHGGKFDQISGATITSRGVINAVQEILEYHHTHHAKLYME